jgi:hypothetical protein
MLVVFAFIQMSLISQTDLEPYRHLFVATYQMRYLEGDFLLHPIHKQPSRMRFYQAVRDCPDKKLAARILLYLMIGPPQRICPNTRGYYTSPGIFCELGHLGHEIEPILLSEFLKSPRTEADKLRVKAVVSILIWTRQKNEGPAKAISSVKMLIQTYAQTVPDKSTTVLSVFKLLPDLFE